jgi:UDP-N-acetylglucosamine 2-epimerase (non-hydrolysing)/GDP/UDP-N,N'-diacetylbacillosamine 2-epimerase (hydrolysing)
MRKILVITGRRAEYGLMRSAMKAIKNHKNLELCLVVTGNHLLNEYGNTIDQIKKDGFKINHIIKSYSTNKSGWEMAFNLGNCICDLVNIFKKEKPDIILVLTDLGHALAGAIVGSHMNIPVAHIHGGDISGTIDESIRHATTKFAHIHFPATEKSAKRIFQMGEGKWRIYNVGAPGLDEILREKLMTRSEIIKKFNLKENEPFILLVQHSVTTEVKEASKQIQNTLDAIIELNYQTIMLYPNADAGSYDMLKVIEKYKNEPCLKVYKNLERKTFLSLLKHTNVLVGNSSSGIIEAPSFKTITINIGTRQQGRERTCNVIDVDYDKKEIISAIKKSLFEKDLIKKVKKCKNPYGEGKASKKIVKILNEIKIDKKLLQKNFGN